MKVKTTQITTQSFQPDRLSPAQVAWLAITIFAVSEDFGALMPVLPAWLNTLMLGAPLWGVVGDRVGYGRILILGLVGFVVASLLLLIPALTAVWSMYALRGATGFFVAAVILVVAALVAEHTPVAQRARRFAWLGTMSLLGFLLGPALTVLAEWIAPWTGVTANAAAAAAQGVVVLFAALGAMIILGVVVTLPASAKASASVQADTAILDQQSKAPLWALSGAVALVLAAFELGIVLQGQEHTALSSLQIAMMFAECSLVMLAVNAVLFLTGLLEKISARTLSAGLRCPRLKPVI